MLNALEITCFLCTFGLWWDRVAPRNVGSKNKSKLNLIWLQPSIYIDQKMPVDITNWPLGLELVLGIVIRALLIMCLNSSIK